MNYYTSYKKYVEQRYQYKILALQSGKKALETLISIVWTLTWSELILRDFWKHSIHISYCKEQSEMSTSKTKNLYEFISFFLVLPDNTKWIKHGSTYNEISNNVFFSCLSNQRRYTSKSKNGQSKLTAPWPLPSLISTTCLMLANRWPCFVYLFIQGKALYSYQLNSCRIISCEIDTSWSDIYRCSLYISGKTPTCSWAMYRYPIHLCDLACRCPDISHAFM